MTLHTVFSTVTDSDLALLSKRWKFFMFISPAMFKKKACCTGTSRIE